MIQKVIILLALVLCFSSCVVVKGYDKVYLNDPDMVLAERKCERNLTIFHSYREASAGANGGKTGGGCGCN